MEGFGGARCERAKKNETVAELSYWYGFDVGGLPESRQFGLLVNLRRLQSQARIESGQYDATDFEAVYNLYLDAYGDEDIAQKAATRAAWALVNESTKYARPATS